MPHYIKEKKVYHFEKWHVDSPNGFFKRCGRFLFDFSNEWPEANKYVIDAPYNKQNYGHSSNKPSKHMYKHVGLLTFSAPESLPAKSASKMASGYTPNRLEHPLK